MAEPRVYAGATALIGLARIRRLDLLTLLPTPICVTRQVWNEVTGDLLKPGAVALQESGAAGLLSVVDEGDPAAFARLDAGESTVLSAAASTRTAVLVDERKARALINTDPALRGTISQVTGPLGLIVLAKHCGYVKPVRPILDDLIAQGFRISAALSGCLEPSGRALTAHRRRD